ncbi:MAG TPA: choice-of-anchor tandem repeat GloVer-containing protein [Bryobacteraceae bacterium]|nr:choice-of-anchor tandem repeat GloVer-containing protein [Bryobacteraceae bacterium]
MEIRVKGWKVRGPRSIGIICLALAGAIASPAQDEQPSSSTIKFKLLGSFGNDGAYPDGLTQAFDGNLYGTALFGGLYGAGTVFQVSPSGTVTTIYNFCVQTNCADGAVPNQFGPLALGADGNLYGKTGGGGSTNNGTIFKLTTSGELTVLYNICSQPNCTDGYDGDPTGLVRGIDGNFYGVMGGGGANNSACNGGFTGTGCGTVYKITPQGAFNTIYNFCSLANCADGYSPYTTLVSGADGNLYGITPLGGANGYGTVYRITLNGTLTTLYSFGAADGNCGYYSCAPMVQAADGSFYGTTPYGGANGAGTIFQITPSGSFTTIYNFCSQPYCSDGNSPYPLVRASDGNFYGGTCCGADGGGTIFQLTPAGAMTTLHVFEGLIGQYPGGASPFAMAQGTNGMLYGLTSGGGASGGGAAFSLGAGLRPFVEAVPGAGKHGMTVNILGTSLSGATTVSFNSIPAAFTAVSNSLITATVPAGAATGFITVTTPGRTFKSNVIFQVRP